MSLRTRFMCLVLLATLLPALLLGWRFARENDAEIADAVKNLVRQADAIATDLDHRVQGTAQLHYGLAHSRMLDSDDRAACSAYLSEVRAAYPQYTGILTVRPDGQLHCDSLQSGRRLDLRDRPYFQRALNGAEGVIVEPAFGRLTGNSVLQIAYPAHSEAGALRFLLVASLNLQTYAQVTQAQTTLTDAQLLLVDGKGTVMAWAGATGAAPAGSSIANSALFQLARRGGTGEVLGGDGDVRVWVVADSLPMQAAGLRVLLGQPRQVLVARSELRLRQGLIVLAGAALLLFSGVWALAERGIRRPVARIGTMVRELGAGNLDARIARPYPRGELGGLMAVLNHTADSLQQQRRAIDGLTAKLRVAHAREISERMQNEDRLARTANYDSLTGLPNRSLFRDRLQQAIARTRRSARPFAVMFLDIDRFKNINDSLGHAIGDRLLLDVAKVLAGCVRGTDTIGHGDAAAAGDDVFRLGGDEFMVLAEDIAGADAVAPIAQRILSALAAPFVIGEHELFISASIGITVCADDSVGLDGLIKQADMAMYRSKALGRDTFCFFDETMNQAAARRHHLEVLLRHALERDEFRLHYQPKADARTGRVTGVEALLRWQPAGVPMVAPDEFIGILEETGLIVPVGAWVFRAACGQMVAWQAAGMRPLRLAVNLSARQFRHQDLVGQVAGVLADTGFDARHLELELTESMLIDDTAAVARILADLGAMGVRIAIDDFGTGQSSLRYLQRFNVDTLKIDRSFVKDTPGSAEDSAIATAVIALGHSLGLNVVAEGVETPQQAAFLRALRCDELQGYLLSRPLPADDFATWFASHEAVNAVALA